MASAEVPATEAMLSEQQPLFEASIPLLGAHLEAEGARQEEALRAKQPERAKSTALSQLFRCDRAFASASMPLTPCRSSIFFAFIAVICFIGALTAFACLFWL